MSYPPDFQSWPQERRNAWFAAEARGYRETKAPGNGAADHAKLQGGFGGFDSSLGKGFPQNNGAWPEPTPIESALPAVAPFDAELLPDALRDYVFDVADRQQSPPDFSAVAAQENPLPHELPKLTKVGFEGFEGDQGSRFSGIDRPPGARI